MFKGVIYLLRTSNEQHYTSAIHNRKYYTEHFPTDLMKPSWLDAESLSYKQVFSVLEPNKTWLQLLTVLIGIILL